MPFIDLRGRKERRCERESPMPLCQRGSTGEKMRTAMPYFHLRGEREDERTADSCLPERRREDERALTMPFKSKGEYRVEDTERPTSFIPNQC
jgi:hypothetical protein